MKIENRHLFGVDRSDSTSGPVRGGGTMVKLIEYCEFNVER